MNRLDASGAWFGFLMVGWATLWLADSTGVASVSPIVFAVFFALAGIGFAVAFARDPNSWWAAIPAGALLGLAGLIAFVEGTAAPDVWGAAILLACSGFGFGAVWLRSRGHWWALIPSAALLIVAIVVASVPIVGRGEEIGVVALVVMAGLLVALALIPIRGRRLLWPLIPAAILGIVAGFLAADAEEVLEPFNWVSAVAVLVVGLVVMLRTLSGRGAGRQNP